MTKQNKAEIVHDLDNTAYFSNFTLEILPLG